VVAKITVERILRDDDDDSGQTVRQWAIESEAGHVTIKMNSMCGFLLLRTADIEIFAADLQRARDASMSLAAESTAT
jgi:hypothetical protein